MSKDQLVEVNYVYIALSYRLSNCVPTTYIDFFLFSYHPSNGRSRVDADGAEDGQATVQAAISADLLGVITGRDARAEERQDARVDVAETSEQRDLKVLRRRRRHRPRNFRRDRQEIRQLRKRRELLYAMKVVLVEDAHDNDDTTVVPCSVRFS